jgi:hypothetical protein
MVSICSLMPWRAVVLDRLLTPFELAVVVHDEEPAGLQLRIESLDRGHCAFVHVPIESRDRESLDWGLRQRVLEPALEETHLFVEEPVAVQIGANLLQ